MSAWSVLSNAHHIDRVIESLKTHVEFWDSTQNETLIAAYNAAQDTAQLVKWLVARPARERAFRHARRPGSSPGAVNAGLYAIAALVAWDDSAQFLEMDGDALEIYSRLSDDPRAVLLLPAVRAFERIKKLEAAWVSGRI